MPKTFGVSYAKAAHVRFTLWPRRLTLKCNPAIYTWLGYNFTMPWTKL